MSDILMLLVFVHVLPVGLALWGVFRRNPWFHVPATIVLASELVSLWMAGAINVGGIGGAGLVMIVVGPVLAPTELWDAAGEAPAWVVPLLALGGVVAAGVWWLLWRRTKRRVCAAAGLLVGAAVTWVAAEIAIEVQLRTQAGRQFASYCNFGRLPAPLMLAAGLSDFGVPSHAVLSDRSTDYLWSFGQNRWVKRNDCYEGSCQCYHGALRVGPPPGNS